MIKVSFSDRADNRLFEDATSFSFSDGILYIYGSSSSPLEMVAAFPRSGNSEVRSVEKQLERCCCCQD